MAKKSKTIKVFPEGQVWVVQKVGSSRASAIKDTKREAYEVARDIALNQGLLIRVYDKYGNYLKTVRPQDTVDEECFITTACVNYYHLDDDCYELRTLRRFRDSYLLKKQETKPLVGHYYNLAPKLISCLEVSLKKDILYNQVFTQVQKACILIENNQYEQATLVYIEAILFLVRHFDLELNGRKR